MTDWPMLLDCSEAPYCGCLRSEAVLLLPVFLRVPFGGCSI
jgi:hypothetical protein